MRQGATEADRHPMLYCWLELSLEETLALVSTLLPLPLGLALARSCSSAYVCLLEFYFTHSGKGILNRAQLCEAGV